MLKGIPFLKIDYSDHLQVDDPDVRRQLGAVSWWLGGVGVAVGVVVGARVAVGGAVRLIVT